MHDLLGGAAGEYMEPDAFHADFKEKFWATEDPGFWKLERQQHFKEPDHESWQAFARGDWDQALHIIEAGRPAMRDYYRKVETCGFDNRRVRVVEEPITPYLQWEMQILRMRDEYGGTVRIVTEDQVADFERTAPLPEIFTLGTTVMYRAVYDDEGVFESAYRYVDRDLVVRCQRFIQDLFEIGQPMQPYFAEHVAVMPPPRRP